jgi:putative ABC transport system permease protein
VTRRSRLSTAGLLLRHLRSGVGASLLVALLIAASVLAVALAPRALSRLGTAELRHELGQESPALLDLTGIGRIGIAAGLPASASLDDVVGETDRRIAEIRERLPRPLRTHLGPVNWVATTTKADGILPVTLPLKLSMKLGADLRWRDRVRFTDGEPPAPWTGDESAPTVPGEAPAAPPSIPAAISADAAKQLHLKVGDLIGYSPAPVLVTGIYEPVNPDDAYWVHQVNLTRVTFETEQGELTTAHIIVYVDPLSMRGLTTDFQTGQLSAYLEVDPTGMSYSEAAALQEQVHQMQASQIELPMFGSLNFRSGLPDAIDRVVARVTSASALLALSVSGLLGVLLAVFALGVQSVIARRRPALALAAARGAGAVVLRGAMVLEGLLVSLPGAALAVVVAAVLLPGDPGPVGWILPAAIAVAPAALFGVMTSPRQLREPRSDLQVRSRSRVRWIIEVAVAGLAVLSLILLGRRGLVASSAAVGVDPLLAATPLLLAAAVCAGVLRLYPAPLRLLQRVFRRRSGPAGLLGAARAIRDPALGFAASLALVVGISVVVFTTVMSSTVRIGLVQGSVDTVGADARITAQRLDETVLAQVRRVEGVTAAVAVPMVTGVEVGIDSDTTQVLAVLTDTAAMHEIRPDLPDLSARDADGAVPVLVSTDWADHITGARLSVGGKPLLERGTIGQNALPGATRHFVYLDSSFASDLGIPVDGAERAFLGLSPDTDPAEVASEVDDVVTAAQPPQYRGLVDVVTARQLLDDIRSSPTVAAIEAALLIAAAASLALTMLTVVLASVAAAAARNRLVGVLRILGMSPRQLRAIQAWELGPVAITAVVAGTALGLVLPLIVTSALDLRPFVGGDTQPPAAIEPLWVLGAVGAFALVVLVAGVIAGILGRRFAPAGTLKMGEG